jgi:hypothetical protein
MDKMSSVNYLNFSLRMEQAGLIKTPSSTTLANFVGSVLSHSLNTAYTAHSVRPNFGYAETSYMVVQLYKIPNPPL